MVSIQSKHVVVSFDRAHFSMNSEGFGALLAALQTPEPETQREAERVYWEFVRADPSTAVSFLFAAAQERANGTLAKLAFILLFRLFKEEFISCVSADVHRLVSSGLLGLLENPVFSVDTYPLLAFGIAAIAQVYLRSGGFGEFLSALLRLSLEGGPNIRGCALECLHYCVEAFGESALLIDHEALLVVLRSVFQEGQTNSTIAAGIRLVFSLAHKKYIDAEIFEFVPLILTVYARSVSDDNVLSTLLFDFYVCCHITPAIFEQWIGQVVDLVLHVVSEAHHSESVRRTAVDILSVIGKRYITEVVARISDICMVYLMAMAEVGTEDEWDDETTFSATISRSFGELAESIAPETFVGTALPLIHGMIKESKWEGTYAGLRGLRKLVPACYSALTNSLSEIIQCLVVHFKHPHPRVRREAYDALTRYIQIEDVVITYRDGVLSALIEGIEGECELFVKAGAVCTLSCVCRNLPKEILEPLVDPIATSLIGLFQCGNPGIQAQVVRTLSSMAMIAPESMSKFYPGWMEMTKSLLVLNESDIGLMCRVIESVVFLSRLVPCDVFGRDGVFLVNTWLSWKWDELPDEIFHRLLTTLGILLDQARDLCVEKYKEIMNKLPTLLISTEPTCVRYNAYEMGPQSLRADKLTFLTQDNVYLEYDIVELQKMQMVLEFIHKLIVFSGNTCVRAFFPFRKRLVRFMQWDFFSPIQIAAVKCMTLILTQESIVLSHFSEFIRLRLTSNSLSPAAQKTFLEAWRKVVLCEISAGTITEHHVLDLLALFPVMLNKIYQPHISSNFDESLHIWQVEEPLAKLAIDLYDRFTAIMLEHAFQIFTPIANAQAEDPSAFLVLTSAKHATFSHDLPLQSVLTVTTDSLTDETPDVARIACEAMSMIVGSIEMEGEFINEVLCSTCLTITTHARAKPTVDAALVLLTKLMEKFPQICLNAETVETWIGAMPLTTEGENSNYVYEFLVFLLSRPDLFPMTEPHFVKTVSIIIDVAGTSLISQSTFSLLQEFLVSSSNDPTIAGYIDLLDDVTKQRLQQSGNLNTK